MKKLIIGLMGMVGFVAMGASFSYQGVLRDETGGKLEGSAKTQTIEFRLYDQPTGGTVLWGRTVAVHLDDDGLFNVELGDAVGSAVTEKGADGKDDEVTTNLDDVLAAKGDGTLYIGLTVRGSSGEIRPRQKVLAVPVASYAQDVKMAKNGFTVTGEATVNGALTVNGMAKIGTNRVNVLSVEDSAVLKSTRVTGELNITGGKVSMAADTAFTIGGISAVIPKGVIVMWSGATSEIPAGWALCNGANGTPDLRDRFIVGAGGSYSVKDTGGANSVTLTVKQMPSHSHTINAKASDLAASWKNNSYFFDFSQHYNNPRSTTTEAEGGNEAHENRPPYYALCFIMKL